MRSVKPIVRTRIRVLSFLYLGSSSSFVYTYEQAVQYSVLSHFLPCHRARNSQLKKDDTSLSPATPCRYELFQMKNISLSTTPE
ncbi:hypothetical protein F4677DRAFT_73662 [Hypoxylon crocopeplum]|nr:hypothetical protein F4677DRAFT_73662 [Hypoxylon crocopeplum]